MKKSPRFLLLVLSLILGQVASTAMAQDAPAIRDSIYSNVLKEKRIVQVVLPSSYKPNSKEKYDVVYVLDGGTNTNLTSQIQQNLEQEKYMPSTIVVGILNVDRNRDFTPTHVDNTPVSGGAANFLAFLKNELVPFINKNYPTTGENTLYGHSHSGTFAMYALLTDPQVFESYIAADPSFWWDNGYLVKLAAEKLSKTANFHQSLFITGREGSYPEMKIDAMDSVLQAKAPAELHWKVVGYPDETHGSVRLKSVYDGLKFTYAGYNVKHIVYHPMNGIILKDKPIKMWCFSNPALIRYTKDGTIPTQLSPNIEKEFTLAGPTDLHIKLFANRTKYDKAAQGHFSVGEALPASTKPKNTQSGGFQYAYYEGKWDKLPDFKKLKPTKSGLTDKDFEPKKLPSQATFACLIEGYIEVEQEGYYLFAIDVQGACRLSLGKQALIDYDGVQEMEHGQSYILPLEKGFYPIRLEYVQQASSRPARFRYLIPNSNEPISIPLERQYHCR